MAEIYILDGMAMIELRKYAEANPMSWDELLDIKNGVLPMAGDRPLHVVVSSAHRIAYSIEHQNVRLRHLSISHRVDKFPSIHITTMVMGALGFKKPLLECSVTQEEGSNGIMAMNIIEVIE